VTPTLADIADIARPRVLRLIILFYKLQRSIGYGITIPIASWFSQKRTRWKRFGCRGFLWIL